MQDRRGHLEILQVISARMLFRGDHPSGSRRQAVGLEPKMPSVSTHSVSDSGGCPHTLRLTRRRLDIVEDPHRDEMDAGCITSDTGETTDDGPARHKLVRG